LKTRGALLAYFARYNDKEAIPLIEERLNKLSGYADSTVFYNITTIDLSLGLERFLQKRLETGSLDAATALTFCQNTAVLKTDG